MLKGNKLMACALVALAIAGLGCSTNANAATTGTTADSSSSVVKDGWIKGTTSADSDVMYYYENGNKVTGEHKIGNQYYIFDVDGHMLTNVWATNGKVTNGMDTQNPYCSFYYGNDGTRASGGFSTEGWHRTYASNVSDQGDWVYFDNNNTPEKGWLMHNNGTYYLDMTTGRNHIGWMQLGSYWFYFDKNGKQQFGWVYDNGTWYHMNRNGVMETGWHKINGKWYFLQSSGAMKTGWLKDAGSWYLLGYNGDMQTGWVKSGSSWYFLYNNGIMAESCMIGSYHVNASGVWDK